MNPLRSPVPTDDAPNGLQGLQGPRRKAAIAAVLAAMVLAVLDAAIANVALPTMARSLQVTPSMAVWIITAYQTALVMGLLPCAALGESLGYRRVFTIGVALFTAASALCAGAPSLPWLVAARFLQGLGGAAIMALGIALLRMVVPQRELGAAIGWNALACRALPDLAGPARPLDRFSVALNAAVFASLVVGAVMTGLYMTPWSLTVAVAAPLSGYLANRVPTAWLCAAGATCLALGLAAASL